MLNRIKQTTRFTVHLAREITHWQLALRDQTCLVQR